VNVTWTSQEVRTPPEIHFSNQNVWTQTLRHTQNKRGDNEQNVCNLYLIIEPKIRHLHDCPEWHNHLAETIVGKSLAPNITTRILTEWTSTEWCVQIGTTRHISRHYITAQTINTFSTALKKRTETQIWSTERCGLSTEAHFTENWWTTNR
jgi:hypothetical protein